MYQRRSQPDIHFTSHMSTSLPEFSYQIDYSDSPPRWLPSFQFIPQCVSILRIHLGASRQIVSNDTVFPAASADRSDNWAAGSGPLGRGGGTWISCVHMITTPSGRCLEDHVHCQTTTHAHASRNPVPIRVIRAMWKSNVLQSLELIWLSIWRFLNKHYHRLGRSLSNPSWPDMNMMTVGGETRINSSNACHAWIRCWNVFHWSG